ncbi:MAG: AAA family ATPase, partial [Myxococcota bacterium]
VAIGVQLAEALQAAHRGGILHRDIKPSNIFLVDKDVTRIVLVDFGLASAAKGESGTFSLTVDGELLGTPGFIAPEQARGHSTIDQRADLYSLGVVLFTCLGRRPPFLASHVVGSLAKLLFEAVPRIGELRDDVPEALDELIAQLMSREPDERLSDTDKVLSCLRPLARAISAGDIPDAHQLPALRNAERCFWSLLVIAGRDRSLTRARLVEIAVRHGAELRRLSAYSATALICVDDTLPATVTRAARCALDIRAIHPNMPLAIATGHGEPGYNLLRRAVALWRNSSGSESQPSTAELSEPSRATRPGLPAVVSSNPRMRVEFSGERRTPTAARRRAAVRFSTLLGRDGELAELNALFTQCVAARTARLALVYGAPGSGKSRLLHEFAQRPGQPPAQVWSARGEPSNAVVPLGLLRQILRCALDLNPGDSPSEHHKRLTDRVCRSVASKDAERVAVFLGELLGSSVAGDDHPLLSAARADSRVMHEHMYWAWHDWLDAETACQPVLIAIDDIQWGDRASLRFIGATLRNLANRPLMIGATADRDSAHASDNRTARPRAVRALRDSYPAHELHLDPLANDVCRDLAQSVLGQSAESLSADLAGRCAGDLRHLEELLGAAQHGQRSSLPDSASHGVKLRLAMVDHDDRSVLQAVSVFGQAASAAGIAEVFGAAPIEIRASIARLLKLGILATDGSTERPDDQVYRFVGSLVQTAVYTAIPTERRRRWHRRAADWLHSAGRGDSCVVAAHLRRAGLDQRAVPWLCRAAMRALCAGEYEDALALAREAVECGAEGSVLGSLSLIQAEAYNRNDKPEAAYLCACNAMDLLDRDSPTWLRAARHVVLAASSSDRFAELAALAYTRLLLGESGRKMISSLGTNHDGAHVVEALHALNIAGALGRVIQPDPSRRGRSIPAN